MLPENIKFYVMLECQLLNIVLLQAFCCQNRSLNLGLQLRVFGLKIWEMEKALKAKHYILQFKKYCCCCEMVEILTESKFQSGQKIFNTWN